MKLRNIFRRREGGKTVKEIRDDVPSGAVGTGEEAEVSEFFAAEAGGVEDLDIDLGVGVEGVEGFGILAGGDVIVHGEEGFPRSAQGGKSGEVADLAAEVFGASSPTRPIAGSGSGEIFSHTDAFGGHVAEDARSNGHNEIPEGGHKVAVCALDIPPVAEAAAVGDDGGEVFGAVEESEELAAEAVTEGTAGEIRPEDGELIKSGAHIELCPVELGGVKARELWRP